MARLTLKVNGARRHVNVAEDTPLLYVLKNDLPARWAQRKKLPAADAAANTLHPVQQAWIDEPTWRSSRPCREPRRRWRQGSDDSEERLG